MNLLIPVALGALGLMGLSKRKASNGIPVDSPSAGIVTIEGNDGVLWFAQANSNNTTTVFDPRTNKKVLTYSDTPDGRMFVQALGEPGIVAKALVSLDIESS